MRLTLIVFTLHIGIAVIVFSVLISIGKVMRQKVIEAEKAVI